MKYSLIVLTLFAIFTTTAPAQIKLTGNVVEFIDAKTVVVEMPSGRIKVELQGIDVPEPQQVLHALVSEHVRKMLVGKSVEVQTNGFSQGKTTGKLTLNGVDVSQQLLRDGAAWHLPAAMSGQSQNEFAVYAEAESLAKKEKRGVWSIAGLKPGWQIRAEVDQARRDAAEASRRSRPAPVGVDTYHTDTRRVAANTSSSASSGNRSQMDAWVSVFAGVGKEGPGIRTINDPNGRYNVVFTSSVVTDFSATGQKEKLEVAAGFVTVTAYNGAKLSMHLIAFRAIASDFRFPMNKTRMTAVIDGKAIPLGAPMTKCAKGMIGGGEVASEEIMYFRTSAATLGKMGKANKVEFRINKLSGMLPAEARDLFRQLAEATN
jgi:endonuclease YncB( thermonuclease family)